MGHQLVFATRNAGKLAELKTLLAELPVTLLSLDDIDCDIDVVEDRDTFAGNARKKAETISRATGLPALADDSGLEVDALGGAPGVYSARYAGEHANDDDNNRKLVEALRDTPQDERAARFRSVLVLADVAGRLGDQVLTAAGSVEGHILTAPRGDGGFGYDPLFYCPELEQTFAEAGIGPKNGVSHRARAMRALLGQLEDYFRLENPGHSG